LLSTQKDTDLVLLYKGVYKIKLVVEDSSVCYTKKDSMERTFTLFPEVYPDFTWERDSCGFSVQFINTSPVLSGDSIGFKWLFGDGSESFETSPYHTFPSGRTYDVFLYANPHTTC